ncbi:MAG: N-acetyl-gamma-glutamyl-phosphate reductase, partial [Gammaproteobacteria bacterium HGW-Gammaproteobacteria-14]
RGIHSTLYAPVTDSTPSLDMIQQAYESRYQDEPFVDVMPMGSHPETRFVKGANHCRLAIHRPQNRDYLVILSVIDNLTKGAAGQAIQNMNIMFDLPEAAGLGGAALLP